MWGAGAAKGEDKLHQSHAESNPTEKQWPEHGEDKELQSQIPKSYRRTTFLQSFLFPKSIVTRIKLLRFPFTYNMDGLAVFLSNDSFWLV